MKALKFARRWINKERKLMNLFGNLERGCQLVPCPFCILQNVQKMRQLKNNNGIRFFYDF